MRWGVLLLAGWATITGGLFLGSLTGTVVAEQFGFTRNYRLLTQGLVMSGIVVPIILCLYQYFYRITGTKPKKAIYNWKKTYHFFTGLLLAIGLAFLGIFLATSFGWISIEKWHTPDQWLMALLVNIGIAFLYEALPEELALRGFLFDVLRHRFATWAAVLLQTLLFLSVPLTTTLLQVLIGLAPGNNINGGYIMLILLFGICLQLLRLWTGSLWTAIGFHLGYLEITRFVVNNNYYGSSILSYQESFPGLGVLFISLGMIVVGGIVVSLFLLSMKRLLQKN